MILSTTGVYAAILFLTTIDVSAAFTPTIWRSSPARSIRRNAPSFQTPHSFRRNTGGVPQSTCLHLTGQELIEAGVSFDTFAPQFLWLLMIAAPGSEVTKKVMGPLTPMLGLAAVHLCIVLLAASQEGALSQVLIFKEVFDPSLSQLGGMQKLFAFQNFVAEEWPHVLIWDLFVGRAVWLDGLSRGIDTRVALSFCNFIGPPGLLIHTATCLLSGKGLPPMGFEEKET